MRGLKQYKINTLAENKSVALMDNFIQRNVEQAMEQLEQEIKSKDVNILSIEQREEISDAIRNYKMKISKIFRLGFSETEQKIKQLGIGQEKISIENEKIETRLMISTITNSLDEMDKRAVGDEKMQIYIMERKMFLIDALERGLLDNPIVEDLLEIKKCEKDLQL